LPQRIHNRVSHLAFSQDPILFNRIELDPGRAYFLYIGELKAYGLNPFLIPQLESIYGRPVECVALVPDVLKAYPLANLAVLNRESFQWWSNHSIRVNCRPSAGQFAQEVSDSFLAQELLETILDKQDSVYVHMFESRPEMSLIADERVKLLGPEPSIAYHFNNKITQYQMACQLGIPVPEGFCCDCLEEAMDAAENFFRSGEQVFVSEPYSAAGSNSVFACSCEEIQQRFGDMDKPYLVTRRVPHSLDPTVLAVVANSREVYVASVADQIMEKNKFRGSTFPTMLSEEVVDRIREYTRLVGKHMGAQGYRGMFGCDYLVDDQSQVYFVEVNARKQGTTLESALTMLHRLPGHPNLLEIEFCAITQSTLPQGLTEMDSTQSDLCWGTYNVKCSKDILVNRGIPHPWTEAELFRSVAQGPEDWVCANVEDHLGPGIYQCAGGFVGRCVSVGRSAVEVKRQLNKKVLEVRSTIQSWDSCS
jgi:hypothetical protein